MTKAAIFCGDRNWDDYAAVLRVMASLKPDLELIIQGDARGADRISGICADAVGMPQEVFPAEWKRLGRAAGPARNQQMLNRLLAMAPRNKLMVVAFHDDLAASRGTKDMADRAKKAGIRVKVVRHKSS